MSAPNIADLTQPEKDTLRELGWVARVVVAETQDSFLETLLALASSLGRVSASRGRGADTSAAIEVLRPVTIENATRRSLSRKFGLGVQPWHMDMAHKIIPARFIVMGMYACLGGLASFEQVPTQLLNAGLLVPSDALTPAHSEPFLFRSGSGSFYATILSKERDFVRFDPGCMEPVTPAGAALLADLVEQNRVATHTHAWQPGSILIVNNWRFLHRRGDARVATNRVLYRVSVFEG